MLSRLYRYWLTAAGYRWTEPFRHPLEVHKPRAGRDPVEIRRRQHKQAVLQAHIHRHAEVERQRRLSKREQEVRERLDAIIERIFVLVDRRGYEAGLW